MESFENTSVRISLEETAGYPSNESGDNRYQAGRFRIALDDSRDALLTDFGRSTLRERYLLPGETIQQAFARCAAAFADDAHHAQRLYDMISKLWFMPATPVLSNGGAGRGMPISCFLNSTDDSLEGIVAMWTENVWLASNGGGIGNYWGNLRSIGERVGKAGATSGIIPFIAVQDRMTLAISQGSLRRGSAAVYLDIGHPEIEEFLHLRKPTGGDQNRKGLNLHHGILIPDAFMEAVERGLPWQLRSPKTQEVIREVDARTLFSQVLELRLTTGEPYLIFIDAVNREIPEHHKQLGLKIVQSNLCVAGATKVRVRLGDSEFETTIEELGTYFHGKNDDARLSVWSFDHETREEKWSEVSAWAMTHPNAETLRITDEESGKVIECTPDHLIMTKDRGWQRADELLETDELVLSA